MPGFKPIARAVKLPDGSLRPQPLEDHLEGVGRLCSEFTRGFGASALGLLSGRWHDLGKYAPEWQSFILTAVTTTRDVDSAHLDENEGDGPGRRRGPDHATAGALHAIEMLGPLGHLLAQVIAAHHSGLYDAVNLVARLQRTDKKPILIAARANGIPDSILRAHETIDLSFDPAPASDSTPGALALYLRMLFSALVDADRLDSEAFSDAARARLRAPSTDLDTLARDLDAYLAGFKADTAVKHLRAEILADCRRAAGLAPGLFTLTVPTGGGKTLSSLAFALAHARKYRLQRVIYVIPYTSIIEQTADVFRSISDAFRDATIEHHSNVEDEAGGHTARESERMRLATENWDAPIVVTTSVQFFESLFAARTSRCRKLHNVCQSVVVLDEAQLLPAAFLQPIVDALNLLTRHYKTTVVLSTATQPALATRKRFGSGFRGLDTPREIVTDVDRLYRELKRVEVRLPANFTDRTTWAEIGDRLCKEQDVLAIVGRRADARELWHLMPTGTFHLSALMCGAHRSAVIAKIKRRLVARRDDPSLPPVRVVSTPLIEAGVDIDLPVVFRAFAGLDSIAQAAGRCNREGKLAGLGRVEVFMPPKPAPAGTLRAAENAAIEVLHGHDGDALSRQLFEPYFALFYDSQELDTKAIIGQLDVVESTCGVAGLRTVSERFKLIDNEETGYQSVLVPYRRDNEDQSFATLIRTLEKEGPARWLMRKLQRYSVSLPPHEFTAMHQRGDLLEIIPKCWVVRSAAQYRSDLGLMMGDGGHDAKTLWA